MSTSNASGAGNAGNGNDRNSCRRRPGIPQPRPKKPLSKGDRRRAFIAKLLADLKYPPYRLEHIRVAFSSSSAAVANHPPVEPQLPTVAHMMVAPPDVSPQPSPVTLVPILNHGDTPTVSPSKNSWVKVEMQHLLTTGGNSGASTSAPPEKANVDGGDMEDVDMDIDEAIPAGNGAVVVLSIILRGYQLGDVEVMYNIRTDETFEAVYKDYAERIDVEPKDIKVYNGMTYVLSTALPLPMGVESGSVLYVQGLAGVVNTNTRIKRFYLKNTGHRKKMKLRVQGKLDSPLCRLFHMWGDKMEVDPNDLVFYHEDTTLCTLNTIREAGIKNGDKVVIASNLLD